MQAHKKVGRLNRHQRVVGQKAADTGHFGATDVFRLTQQENTLWVLLTTQRYSSRSEFEGSHSWQGKKANKEDRGLSIVKSPDQVNPVENLTVSTIGCSLQNIVAKKPSQKLCMMTK